MLPVAVTVAAAVIVVVVVVAVFGDGPRLARAAARGRATELDASAEPVARVAEPDDVSPAPVRGPSAEARAAAATSGCGLVAVPRLASNRTRVGSASRARSMPGLSMPSLHGCPGLAPLPLSRTWIGAQAH